MTMELQQQTTETAAPVEPLPPELEYLKSHGEDITEYVKDLKPASTTTAASEQTADAAKTGATPNGQTKTDESETGEVVVGEDGRVRDAKGRFVPVQALRQERGRRQTAEKELTEYRDKWSRLEERWNILMTPKEAEKQAAEAKEVPMPDPDKDIVGFAQWAKDKISRLETDLTKKTESTTQQLTQQNMMQTYRDDTARVSTQRTDYRDAYKHAIQARARELVAFGITDKNAIAKQIAEDEQEIVSQAISGGRSPAETIYALAVAKGYQPKAQEEQNPNGSAQQTTQAPAKTPAQEIVESINRGQETGKTLTGVGGAAPQGLTLDQFMSMTTDEIIAMKATPQGRAQLRSLGAIS